jgi:hypothetical protein
MVVVTIEDDDELYRRIFPSYVHSDDTISDRAFMLGGKPEQNLSVDLAKLTNPEEAATRAKAPGYGLASLKVRAVRELGFEIRHAPLPGNPAHALIEGPNDKAKCRQLAEAARLVVWPA